MATVAAGSLLLISSCADQPVAKPKSALAEFQNQKLNWSSCYDNFECTELIVPIDYTNLKTGNFKISVLRFSALDQKNRIGSLIINPGGPGGSGVDYAYNAQYIFDPEILDRYDIVGFDPRGVARSEPIRCLTDAETDAAYATDSKPDNPQEFAAILDDSKEFVEKCKAKTDHITHFSTAETARDMDILRAALGDKKLNYLGKSYGTYLGTLYAQFFPKKVGRMVLDGAIDPNVTVMDQNLIQAVGFERSLATFIDDCLKQSDCPLPPTKESATQSIISILQTSATNPLPRKKPIKGDDRVATESLLVLGIASALYDDTEGWPKLRTAISQALQGYGDTFLELADIYSGREPDGKYSANELDSGAVIDCLDWPDTRTVEDIQADAKRFTEQAPVLGPYLAYSSITCAYFPDPTPNALTRPTNKITSIQTTPIIIVGTTRDPATPYAWAQGLHEIFTGSILISLSADGHTGQGRGSACVDNPIDAYFLLDKLPKKDISCSL